MKIKVLKNFSCNGVRKSVGQFLTEEEAEKIGEEFGNEFIKNDYLMVMEEEDESDNDSSDSDDDSNDDSGDSNDDSSDSDDDSDDDELKINLDELDKPGLMKLANDLGLEPHHNTGEEKLRYLIQEKLEA